MPPLNSFIWSLVGILMIIAMLIWILAHVTIGG